MMEKIFREVFVYMIFASLVLLCFPQFSIARDFGVLDVEKEIRRYNADVIKQHPDLFKYKCEMMSEDAFSFFRGTAHLMYQDISATPELKSLLNGSPKGLINGDLHAHNFGVLFFRGKKGSYSPEDLDEAFSPAPLSFDLFRLGVSLNVAFHDKLEQEEIKKVVEAMIDGYQEGLEQTSNPDWPDCTLPKILRDFIDDSISSGNEKFFKKFTTRESPNKFRMDKKLLPVPENEKKPLLANLAAFLSGKVGGKNLPADFVKILDVATREDKGLSSIGLKRYFALLQGDSTEWMSSRILEIKQMRPSCVGASNLQTQARDTLKGLEMAHRERDVFLGTFVIGNLRFLVREIFPWSGRLECQEIKKEDSAHFSKALGAILADFHSGSGKNREMAVWVKSNRGALSNWVHKYGKQVREDWKAFKH